MILACMLLKPTSETCPLTATLIDPNSNRILAWVCACGRMVGPMSYEERGAGAENPHNLEGDIRG